LFLAVFGVWFEIVPGLMFSGAAFGFFALNLTEFQQKLKRLLPREDGKGMTRRHLIRIGFLSLGAILITLILGIH
jgi:purine-cytosine permease-like protein